ncbi:MAG: Na(+)-translocating NADH-quinone reductase subunit A [Crocinitomicaceae bacterium]|jgi:Na+-transporting NADH:ubiquinone oxidoreductase subunit A|nr:Na(+)-translocating NADH-quinone reductase subunit A [Crocinitomicaceae bacterium]
MSKTITIRKGLDIKLIGEAEKVKSGVDFANNFVIKTTDFHGLTPKLVVKIGDKVKAGSVLFFDKNRESIKFTSPVSGEVTDIVRGEKRKILQININATADIAHEDFGAKDASKLSGDEVKNHLLTTGLWPLVKMRPLDIIANPADKPKAIFISAFDSSPLAPDYDYVLHGENAAFQAGITALSKLAPKVHLTVNGGGAPDSTFSNAKDCQINKISGKHPAGNVGTQIHHIDPINKGEVVWTINAQDVAIIGRLFLTGKYDASRIVALTGSEVKAPKYYKMIIGSPVSKLLNGAINDGDVRIISGNVLSGTKISKDGNLGYYDNQITVIPEGTEPKFMISKGWMEPGFGKFSTNRSYFSWLMPNKKYRMDTNLNGEIRNFVVTGEMEKVFPFDIYPMQLIKSVMYNDIDLMEKLGIYEVAPEDFALCEFVCTSKIDIQNVIREGLDVIQKECM